MADPFIGQICMFGFSFAPFGWSTCAGQQLTVQQNQALYSLLNTTFGGNGNPNFNLPNLMGRVPLGMGKGSGATYNWGLAGGAEKLTLNPNQVPPLNVSATVKAATNTANISTPVEGAFLAVGKSGTSNTSNYYNGTPTSTVNLGGVTTSANTGTQQAISLMNPFLALNFCIALQGIYPTRD